MYYTHELRTSLQEWRNRLYKAPYSQIENQVSFFFKKIDEEPILRGLLEEASHKFSIDEDSAKSWLEKMETNYDSKISFDDEEKQAAFLYHLSKYAIKIWGADGILNIPLTRGRSFDEQKEAYVNIFVNPMINFLHDKLDKSSSILYLLEKYKKMIEWFGREELIGKYKASPAIAEQILENDLRLFLFNQGIDYPFSTPKSASGRADLVGLIDTKDPLIVEIKIYDPEKNYRKERIISGVSQIIKYTNDYNKDCGYLVIFNISPSEIVFTFKENQSKFPPRLTINNKTYYFIVVNLDSSATASKIGKTKQVEITEDAIFEKIKNDS